MQSLRVHFALLHYYIREKLWRHAQNHCSGVIAQTDSNVFRLWHAFCIDKQNEVSEALAEYKSIESKRDVMTAALIGMQLIYHRNNDYEGEATVEVLLKQEKERNLSSALQAACILWYGGMEGRARDAVNKILDSDADYSDEYTSALLMRAWFDLSTGKDAYIEKCLNMFEKVLQSSGGLVEGSGETLVGLGDRGSGAVPSGTLDIDSAMGKITYLERKAQFWPAQAIKNKLIIQYPFFTPALIVKAKQAMRTQDWDVASEVIERVLSKDPTHIEALILKILLNLVRVNAKHNATAVFIGEFYSALQQREPKNAQLFYTCARCFSLLAGSSSDVLANSLILAQRAIQLSPFPNSEYESEIANIMLLQGDIKGAYNAFKKASQINDVSVNALLGLARCTLLAGKIEDALQTLATLDEMMLPSSLQGKGNSNRSTLLYLHATVAWRNGADLPRSIDMLDQAVVVHRIEMASLSSGLDLYLKLNPPLLVDIAREYLSHCPLQAPQETDEGGGKAGNSGVDGNAEKGRIIIELLLKYVPSSVSGQLLGSQVAFMQGKLDRAAFMIGFCISQSGSTNPEVYMQQARIEMHWNHIAKTKQSLEHALALSFDMKKDPQYNLILGAVLLAEGNYTAAEEAFKLAIDYSQINAQTGVAGDISGRKGTTGAGLFSTSSMGWGNTAGDVGMMGNYGSSPKLRLSDHALLHIQLAQCKINCGRDDEAMDIINKAYSMFAETSEGDRISIAKAALLSQTDDDRALELLKGINPSSKYYVAGIARAADIYLNHKHNRKLFVKCFEKLVESCPTARSFVLLGQAYNAIQEPEMSISVFDKARALDPSDTSITVKIGRAAAATHDYQRAIRYYREALAGEPNRFDLRADLAVMYWRLGDIDKATTTLKESPVMQESAKVSSLEEPVNCSVERINTILLMSKIYSSVSNLQQQALERLTQARMHQNALLSKLRSDGSELLAQQKHIAATICCELGDRYRKGQNTDKARTLYTEAIRHEEYNKRAMIALARLYLYNGNIMSCEQQCNTLMKYFPFSEDGVMILTDLYCRSNRYSEAAELFSELLQKKPDNYNAVVSYIQMLRRAGQLDKAIAVFSNAQTKCQMINSKPDPGLCYAKGLYQRYKNNNAVALKEFNKGRYAGDSPWRQKCITSMAEIFIMPDNENIWEGVKGEGGDLELKEGVIANLKTAESLITEVQDPYIRSLLTGYWLVAHKSKECLEKALETFFEIYKDANNNFKKQQQDSIGNSTGTVNEGMGGGGCRDSGFDEENNINVPALVGMAVVLQMMDQPAKARGHLKRVATANYNPSEDDHYERGWLLLADIYMRSKKYDKALDLLKKAVTVNKSCARGWELMGMISEQEQVYQNASEQYEKAWSILGEKDPSIGYKLAFNYMKAQNYVKAIETCHTVLALHPNYPLIKENVLDRARLMLRP